jgi:hypothetical protein
VRLAATARRAALLAAACSQGKLRARKYVLNNAFRHKNNRYQKERKATENQKDHLSFYILHFQKLRKHTAVIMQDHLLKNWKMRRSSHIMYPQMISMLHFTHAASGSATDTQPALPRKDVRASSRTQMGSDASDTLRSGQAAILDTQWSRESD